MNTQHNCENVSHLNQHFWFPVNILNVLEMTINHFLYMHKASLKSLSSF